VTDGARWRLHAQLEADTHFVASLGLSELLLMDDAQYPWLILVPRIAGATELVDLDEQQQAMLMQEITMASQALRSLFAPHKLNVAALGNVVSQLHVHVIGRFRDDAAWARPVWGAAPAQPYCREACEQRLRALRSMLSG
jgi:diadenosine tetraphosphate (Ap4A) HIT family hydrolase